MDKLEYLFSVGVEDQGLYTDGDSVGSLLWLVLISTAGLAVAFTLTWRAARR
jgi:hypothetical protein